jgi:hypothetical protein
LLFAKIFFRKFTTLTQIFVKKLFFFSFNWSLHLPQFFGKGIFSFICLSILKFLISHVRMALDSQDRTGQSVLDLEDRAPRTEHEGKDRYDRAMKT